MTKLLEATCENNVVKVGGLVVEAEVVTQGKQSSTGIVLLNEDRAFYIATNTTDIVTVIEKLSSVLGNISGALTGLQGGPWSGPPPVIAPDIAAIAAAQSSLNTLKVNLK